MKKIFLVTVGLFLSLTLVAFAQDDDAPKSWTIETTNGTENIALPNSPKTDDVDEETPSTEVLGEFDQSNIIAQDEVSPEPRTIETENGTENVATPTNDDGSGDEVTTQNDELEPDLIAVEDQVFIIYTHEDCPHCAKVEEFVRLNSIADRVEYRQLKNNDDNMSELEDRWDQFDVSSEEEGWPFMVYTSGEEESYAVGDAPIIDVLSDELGIEDPVTEEEGDSSSNNLLLVLGGLFFVAIVGYGIYQFVFGKKE